MKQSRKQLWMAWARPLFAIAMLALVAYNVPWRDRLSWKGPSGSADVAGTIVGDWRENHISFQVAKDQKVGEAWPRELAAQLSTHAPVALDHDALAREADTAAGTLTWRPGMIHVFHDLDPRGLCVGLGFLIAAALTSVTRWWRLLAVAGCAARWTAAFRLTFLGFFFNLVVPGLTGGDVIKAVLVVREHPERRADALVSVIVDRVLGLFVLMALATAVVLLSGNRFAELRWPVTLTFCAMALGLWVVLHDLPRRVLRFDALLARLPLKQHVQSVDGALRMYVRHPVELSIAVGLSAMNHLSIAAGICAFGRAFGDTLSYVDYVGVTSIANAVSALPVAPGGWGVGEAAYGYIFALLGAAPTLGVAVSVTYRLMMMSLGLFGGIFLLLPGGRDVRREDLNGGAGSAEVGVRG